MLDDMALFFCSAMAVGVVLVPLCPHCVLEEKYQFPGPYSSRVVFSIWLLVFGKADEKGFLKLAPFMD